MIDDALDVQDRERIDACEGFVQKNEPWSQDQCARNLESPPLSTRKSVRPLPPEVGNAELLEETRDDILLLLSGDVQGFCDGSEVLFNGELAENRGFLGQVADTEARPLIHCKTRDLGIVDKNTAGIRGNQTHDYIEGGRLACAIGPKQAHDFPLIELEIDLLDYPSASVRLAQAQGFECARSHQKSFNLNCLQPLQSSNFKKDSIIRGKESQSTGQ